MLSGAMDGENCATFESFGLARWRRLEGLAVRTEPSHNDAVA
jgi:hypothetical protein